MTTLADIRARWALRRHLIACRLGKCERDYTGMCRWCGRFG